MKLERLRHIRGRREVLSREIDAFAHFDTWEETCVPSYCHPNVLAAYVSWRRLYAAMDLAKRYTSPGPVLDFGSSIGELGRILPDGFRPYDFIESDEAPARYLMASQPEAVRRTLDSAPVGSYGCVFALDALEHNEDYPELIEGLLSKLRPEAALIVSGPTENAIYRLGRRIAGFRGHYHTTNIDSIESVIARHADRIARVTVPVGLPLFRVSVWRRLDSP